MTALVGPMSGGSCWGWWRFPELSLLHTPLASVSPSAWQIQRSRTLGPSTGNTLRWGHSRQMQIIWNADSTTKCIEFNLDNLQDKVELHIYTSFEWFLEKSKGKLQRTAEVDNWEWRGLRVGLGGRTMQGVRQFGELGCQDGHSKCRWHINAFVGQQVWRTVHH